ncbi:MAG: hypothetical protein OXT65_10005 [Alphaproteobacteria bacterium]|nr:hypothetical protein [Alphaproteobacteria bacterium]
MPENNTAQKDDREYLRLSDRILVALQLSLSQRDIAISELLMRSLEMSVTRGAGGRGFIERREISDDFESAMAALDELKRESRGG